MHHEPSSSTDYIKSDPFMPETIDPTRPTTEPGRSGLKDVEPRRIAELRVALLRQAQRGRVNQPGRVGLQPGLPGWPPGALVAGHHRLPLVGIDVDLALLAGRDLVAALGVTWLADDPRVVPARRQDECHVAVREQVDLENRAPRGDVVPLRRHCEDRRADVGQGDRPAADDVMTFGQIVVRSEEHTSEL